MLLSFVTIFLGIIFFLFVFWKRLKEDYSSDIIFQSATTVLIGLLLGATASKLFFPLWFFWTATLGCLIGMFLMIFKFKLRFYEVFEAFILGVMPIVSLMFFKNSIVASSLNSFLAFVASLILIFFAFYIDLNYKSFTWYKSGKIGFSGMLVAAMFFLIRTIIAFFGINMISCVGKIEIVISGILTLVFVGLLINLGREKE